MRKMVARKMPLPASPRPTIPTRPRARPTPSCLAAGWVTWPLPAKAVAAEEECAVAGWVSVEGAAASSEEVPVARSAVGPAAEAGPVEGLAEVRGGGFGGGGGGGGGGARGWGRNRAQVNRIRGNLTEQYTNSGFDAHPYPLNVAESPRIPSYQETFGFSLGGPLVIPKIYNGSNKTSWFASYNLQRGKTGLDSFSTVPTAAERGGDFSDAVIASGQYAGMVPTIYDPLSSATGTRTAFPGNVIPPQRIDSAAQGLLQYIPLPNLPGQVQNFHLQVPLPTLNDRVMGRIGQQINSKNSLNIRLLLRLMRGG